MKKEKLKNLFVKIYQTEFYQRLFYRPFHAKTIMSGVSAMLYPIIGMILFWVFLTAIDVKPKPENELYETTGLVTRVGITPTNRSNPHIDILTDDGEKISFSYWKGNINNVKHLKGQRVTVYSNRFPRNINKPGITKLIDEYGNELIDGYDYEFLKASNKIVISPMPFLLSIILLALIYLMNGSKKYKNDENQVNLIKE